MAILHNGIYGNSTGKLGSTVTYQLLGKTVVRTIGKSNQPPTEKQLANWKAMAVVNAFLKPLTPFITIGFSLAAAASNMYPQNKALSYNKINALKGTYPDIEMDFVRVRLSMGNLPGLNDLTAELMSGGIKFTWDPENWMGWPNCNDEVMLMAYLPEETVMPNAYFTLGGTRRMLGTDLLEIPPALITQRMELYIAVVASNRRNVSNSQYLGRLN